MSWLERPWRGPVFWRSLVVGFGGTIKEKPVCDKVGQLSVSLSKIIIIYGDHSGTALVN